MLHTHFCARDVVLWMFPLCVHAFQFNFVWISLRVVVFCFLSSYTFRTAANTYIHRNTKENTRATLQKFSVFPLRLSIYTFAFSFFHSWWIGGGAVHSSSAACVKREMNFTFHRYTHLHLHNIFSSFSFFCADYLTIFFIYIFFLFIYSIQFVRSFHLRWFVRSFFIKNVPCRHLFSFSRFLSFRTKNFPSVVQFQIDNEAALRIRTNIYHFLSLFSLSKTVWQRPIRNVKFGRQFCLSHLYPYEKWSFTHRSSECF